MCFVFVLKAWFLAASTNLCTSRMYDGSSLDKLYIHKDLSIITYGKISKLIDLNANKYEILSRDIYYLTLKQQPPLKKWR